MVKQVLPRAEATDIQHRDGLDAIELTMIRKAS
jgi:hypothetical protein